MFKKDTLWLSYADRDINEILRDLYQKILGKEAGDTIILMWLH